MLVLASFVSLVLIFNFFELIGDMLRNNISLWKMFTYLFFLTPQLIYDLLPAQRAGGGAGGFRRDEQAERDHRVQGVRREPVPPGGADPGGHACC